MSYVSLRQMICRIGNAVFGGLIAWLRTGQVPIGLDRDFPLPVPWQQPYSGGAKMTVRFISGAGEQTLCQFSVPGRD
ncbi:hypothetical protein ACMFWY_11210 [Roseiconus sp. JC912]|uniref:hypothetical protein n=1 Tax=Roseiconus sp. JC912 TaxID=3396307 RepID=UPI003A4C5CCF